MARAYMRREEWRARVLAIAVGRVFVGDGGGMQTGSTVTGRSGKRYRVVSPAEMLRISK